MILLYLRLIRSIIFAPIRILGNLFQHKDNLLEWHLYYTSGLGLGYTSVRIRSKYKEQVPADGLLISSYILFVARYFYICDERQTDNVRKNLKQEIGNQNYNPKELSVQIYNTIYDTLNSSEQKVVGELFYKGVPPFPLSILASGYSEGGEPTNSYAKYSFLVFEHKGNLAGYFHMSHGADIVLLPITVGILYDYVVDRLSDKNSKKKLDIAILDLLEAHYQVDCRSMSGLIKLPIEVISKNNINYSSTYAETSLAQTAEDYVDKGVAKGEKGDWKVVIEDLNKAIELNPNDADAYVNRGVAKRNLGDHKGAIQDSNKAIELNPNYAEAYSNRGLAKSNLGDHKGAIKDYNKAIELNPNFAIAYNNRGLAKWDLGDHKGAIQDSNKAIELNPNLAEAYLIRGIAKIELGQKDSGCLDLSKAGELGYSKAYDLIKQLCQ